MMRRILTYGTFDVLHHGHIRLLRRARALGDYLVVGLSTDAFNREKGKDALFGYEERRHDLEAIRYVDMVIPEHEWGQKQADVTLYRIDVLTMGDDWHGQFDFLSNLCEVRYMKRTPGVSSTKIRKAIVASMGPSA